MAKKLTTKSFIEKSQKVHGTKWGYSKVVYVNNRTRVIINCPNCGDFEQIAAKHLSGSGCQKCAKIKNAKSHELNYQIFIERSILIHGIFYNYDKVIYSGIMIPVIIGCPIHGEFEQTPNNHLFGSGCPKCANNIKFTTEEIVKKFTQVHGTKWGYKKTVYKNRKTEVIIDCPIHGEFLQLPSVHLGGCGCPKCARVTAKLTTKSFIEKSQKVHGTKWGYSKVVYKGCREKVIIDCPIHGEFLQSAYTHLAGRGCPKCANENNPCSVSKIETEWLNSIEKKENIIIIRQHSITINNKHFFVDGFCKETNTIYEFNGDYYHGNPNIYRSNDFNKRARKTYGQLYEDTIKKEQTLKEAGYDIISIWEYDYRIQLLNK